jgi:hypothetical protein
LSPEDEIGFGEDGAFENHVVVWVAADAADLACYFQKYCSVKMVRKDAVDAGLRPIECLAQRNAKLP